MTTPTAPRRLDGTPAFLADLLDRVAERGRSLLGWSGKAAPVSGQALVALAEGLLSRRGEASGVAVAHGLLSAFAAAADDDKLAFLLALTGSFGPDPAALEKAIAAYQADPASAAAVSALHHAAEPRRQELIRRLNLAPGGTAALLRMREAVLEALPRYPELRAIDDDFAHLFSSWFNRGFLMLRPIDWTTPAHILEKVMRYEAVHAIADWNDLRSRLEPPDRRCYGFFHPRLADDPLIFVEVALTRAIPEAIGPLLDLKRAPIEAGEATTAVFYSISNTQKGLAGVSFGNFLIKQVVEDLKRDLPNLKTFVTLSPVPGFAAWLAQERQTAESRALDAAAREALGILDQPGWPLDAVATERVRAALVAAAAYYFLKAKNRSGRPRDAVARFHLGNGARLERLNFLGDTSAKGLEQSYGLMVNYLYDLDRIEANHEAYAEQGTVAAASAIRKAVRPVSSTTAE